jgi:hypothetical protein
MPKGKSKKIEWVLTAWIRRLFSVLIVRPNLSQQSDGIPDNGVRHVSAHEDEVIGVAYNLYVMIPIDAIVPVHRFVQNIEIDIRKERTDDSALGRSFPAVSSTTDCAVVVSDRRLSHILISFSTRLSVIRCSRSFISLSWGMVSKYELKSASYTWSYPLFRCSRIVATACPADRRGRNPYDSS